MGHYKITNAFHSVTGLPEDDVITTYHFDTTEDGENNATALKLCGHVAAAWESITAPGTGKPSAWISPEISRVQKPTVKAYGHNGGSPIAMTDWLAMTASNFDQGMPGEVALCLSYNADLTDILEEAPDDADPDSRPERPASRRRGRLFVGPLVLTCGTATEPTRPIDTLRNDLLGLGVFLGNPTDPALTAVDAMWIIYSNAGLAGEAHEIIRCSVDNAFDTQRRRGVKQTNRLLANV